MLDVHLKGKKLRKISSLYSIFSMWIDLIWFHWSSLLMLYSEVHIKWYSSTKKYFFSLKLICSYVLTIYRMFINLFLMLIGSARIFWPFQLNFQSFHPNLKTIHSLNSSLSTCWIVKRHKTCYLKQNSLISCSFIIKYSFQK